MKKDVDKGLEIFNFVEDYKDFKERWETQEHNGIQNGESATLSSTSAFVDSLVYIINKAGIEKVAKLGLLGLEKGGQVQLNIKSKKDKINQ